MAGHIFKGSALIVYLVQRMQMFFHRNQIGKRIIKKMMYLISREKIVRFDYSMFHFGPHSAHAESELNFAKSLNLLQIV